MLTETGLVDMDLAGHQSTWERGRGIEDWTEVRLDMALTSASWLQLFPLAKLYNLETSVSDHSPLLLVPYQVMVNNRRHQFRFENAWLTELMCEQLTRECWEVDASWDIQQKVHNCGQKVMCWGKGLIGNFEQLY